jgi:hypothetical protein
MKQRLRKPLALLLTLAMCLSLLPSMAFAAAEKGDTYTLVKSTSETLEVGDKVVIGAFDSAIKQALGSRDSTNNRPGFAVTKSADNNTITILDNGSSGENAAEITLEEGETTGQFRLKIAAGYLYAPGGGNYLKILTGTSVSGDGSSWTIALDANGNAILTATTTGTQKYLRHNPNGGSPLFSCYNSTTESGTNKNIAIYRKAATPSVTKIAAPIAAVDLKYTGSEQIGVAEGTGYTLSGTVKTTDAGEYTATATLVTGYEWNEGDATAPRTINWSISKADALAAPQGLVGVAPTSEGGADGKITGVTDNMEWKKAADADTDYASVGTGLTVITGLETGSYHVRLKSDANHELGQAATVEVPAFTPANKVAMPTATPMGGTNDASAVEVEKGSFVVLASTTQDTEIFFTLDKSVPGTAIGGSTQKYSGTFKLEGNAGDIITINAIAVKADMLSSDVLTATYKIKADDPIPSDGYTLVTDKNQLVIGDTIIIATKLKETTSNKDYALGIYTSGNYVPAYESVKAGNTIEPGASVSELMLEAGTIAGTFAFKQADGKYVYAPGGGNNMKADAATKTDDSSWSVEIAASDSNATVKSNASVATTQVWMRFNYNSGTNPRFSCYTPEERKGSGNATSLTKPENDIVLYRKPGGSDPGPGTVADPAYTGSTTVLSGTKVKFTCATTDAKIEFSKTSAAATDFAEQSADGVEITGNVGADVKVWVKASKQGMNPSAVKEFVFTIKDPNASAKNVKEVADAITSGSTAEFTVQGQLVYKYGSYGSTNSAILQDTIGGAVYALQIYSGLDGINLGDIVKVTGTGAMYRGVPQLSGINAVKIDTAALPTIERFETWDAAIAGGDSMISRVVKIPNVYLGAYSSGSTVNGGSTPINDAVGTKLFDIYQAAPYPTGLAAGDKVDVIVVLSKNNTAWQGRNGSAAANGFDSYEDTGPDTKAPVITIGTFPSAIKDADYLISAEIIDNRGVTEAKLIYKVNAAAEQTKDLVKNVTNGKYEFTIPAAEINAGGKLELTITAKDAANNAAATTKQTVDIIDLPQVTDAKPTGDKIAKKPTIEVSFTNAPTATAKLTLKQGGAVVVNNADMTVSAGKATYAVATDLADETYTATVVITRSDSKSVTHSWSFTVGEAKQKFYFGQLHSHTGEYSDGVGTLDEALRYIEAINSKSNVQFVAFTDHSNYFANNGDTTVKKVSGKETEVGVSELALYDKNGSARFNEYKSKIAAFNEKVKDHDIIALGGFEMTWSGGPGHINTFNTDGIVSRNNSPLNNKTNDYGLQLYYNTLKQDVEIGGRRSVSQFNHPGDTFGTFIDFAYWDADVDSRMALLEVGNGEGTIGSGGYFPSYEHYTNALDKGWHVAPTNNQDNHKGKWGDANDARTVIITNDFTEQGLYNAMLERRMYATEDKNLEIMYTVNDAIMGSRIPESENVKIDFTINDPDTGNIGDKTAKVEVIANGGRVVYTWDVSSYKVTGTVTLPAKYTYYYLRVTQTDKNLAVTAPVWVGEANVVGIGGLKTPTPVPVLDEELEFNAEFFSKEETDALVKNVKVTVDGKEIAHTAKVSTLQAGKSVIETVKYMPTILGNHTIAISAEITVNGKTLDYTKKLDFKVRDGAKMVYIGIDAAHDNEYVSARMGYKASMGNFTKLAAGYNVRVVELDTVEKLIAATKNPQYKVIALTPPGRRNMKGLDIRTYGDAEINAIADFAKAGGTVIVTGYADYYELANTTADAQAPENHMAAQQNNILKAIGSTLRISDDEAKDNDYSAGAAANNGGTIATTNTMRLYLSNYNRSHPLLKNVIYDATKVFEQDNVMRGMGYGTQVYSQYGGTTIYAVDNADNATSTLANTVTPMVYGYQTTYSTDDDKDGLGGPSTPKYATKQYDPTAKVEKDVNALLINASETLPNGGQVIVSGGTFFSNFEVRVDMDNPFQLPYANLTIVENLLESLNPAVITKIADVQKAENGKDFTIEGVVTANASGFDRATAFFDCTYLQDETGGINLFPVSGAFQIGQKLRVSGTTSSYQGERQLAVDRISVIERNPIQVEPKSVTTMQVRKNEVLGQLVKVEGVIVSFKEESGAIQTIIIRDSSGGDARVFIDGYITTDKDVTLRTNLKVGNKITAVGLASYDNTFADGPAPRIRIRDRDDVECKDEQAPIPSEVNPNPTPGDSSATPVVKPDDVKVGEKTVEVKLPSVGAKLNDAASEKLVAANADKPVHLTGGGLNVIIPAGTLSAGADVNAMLVNPKASGSVIKVTKSDGTTAILPIATVSGGQAAYVANIPGKYEVVDNTKTFPDASGHWALPAIGFVSARELFKGDSAGAFNPDQPMTRGMLATVLARIDGGRAASGTPFADVSAGSWYAKEIAWAAQNKLVEGDGKNFNPDSDLTREQLCVILARYLDYSGLTLSETKEMGEFSDFGKVSSWAKDAVEQAVKTGLISGKSGERLDPQGKATRAEIATILQRFVEGVLK